MKKSVDIDAVIANSIMFIESQEYKSYDVFDALTNPWIDKITRGLPFLRRVAIQLNAKSPVNFRWTGMKRMVHTKTISDMLSAYSLLYSATLDPDVGVKARQMLQFLIGRSLKSDNGLGWGLNFPYATRFVDAGTETPNLYNTVNSLNSILDFYSVWHDEDLRHLIRSVVSFVVNDLGVVMDSDGCAWVRYYPGQTHATFNVNALAASAFVKANILLNEEVVESSTVASLLNMLKKNQNADGSWFYALSEKGKWVDGFHSGFILESLAFIMSSLMDTYELQQTVRRGFEYYIKNLFTSDMFPCYYPGIRFPVESQNSAQAIQTLANCSRYLALPNDAILTRLIANVIENLYDPQGFFYYKRERLSTFRQAYFRWSQTPMILALIYAKEAFRK